MSSNPKTPPATLEHYRGEGTLTGVHHPDQCADTVCSIHNRSDHSMREFPQHWRGDRRIMERICPHGVGHPDPDDYRILNGEDSGVHGCDGCCSDPEEPADPLPGGIFATVTDSHRLLYLNNARFYYAINLASKVETPEEVVDVLIEALAGACQAFEDAIKTVQQRLQP